MQSLTVRPRLVPVLDPGFVPAVLWHRAYLEKCRQSGGARLLAISLERSDGTISRFDTTVLPEGGANDAPNLRHVERLLKFLLWSRGGWRVVIAGDPEIAASLAALHSENGERRFDFAFMGEKVYGRRFTVESCPFSEAPAAKESAMPLGRHLDGCRIGFDLGGSDRKCAAVIDGKVVFSEEVTWDPYFQSDPQYHYDGINDTLKRAAAHLPRVDAIGGSAAGVYVNNEVRAASLFRGVSEADFERRIRRIFFDLREAWNGIPFEVANDGEVTALAASMSLGVNSVLGISLGTSTAAGFVNAEGNITPWLNELAFTPFDLSSEAPRDEWSGDFGCGVQFFSQQAVARLAPKAGLTFPAGMKFAEQLVEVQKLVARGDDRARRIYESIGVVFGYSLAHCADFYGMETVLILGRVTSGEGGSVIISKAAEVLQTEFQELSGKLKLTTPDEKDKRHGQAVAAASLPALAR